ncbi:MAG: ABC transporter permease subunit [Acidimicrobiaceae bacterium]|nr:ABC transporter permease subunit [Acidimicrobiaceae bacterium]
MNRLVAYRNPILARELYKRSRARSTAVILTSYLFFFGLVFCWSYYVVYDNSERYAPNQYGYGYGFTQSDYARLGQQSFETALILILCVVGLLVPAIAANSIVGERRSQTLMPIQLSLLRPFDIVFGKIASSVMLIVLLVLATMPVLMVPYMIGGIRFSGVVGGLAVIVLTAFFVSAVSVLMSTLMKSSVAAIILSYVITAMFSFGLFTVLYIGIALYISLTTGWLYDTPVLIDVFVFLALSINPLVALAHASTIAASSDGLLGELSENLTGATTGIWLVDFLASEKIFWLGFYLVIVGILSISSVRWACRKLRLPAKK